jgi:hypothetical protein
MAGAAAVLLVMVAVIAWLLWDRAAAQARIRAAEANYVEAQRRVTDLLAQADARSNEIAKLRAMAVSAGTDAERQALERKLKDLVAEQARQSRALQAALDQAQNSKEKLYEQQPAPTQPPLLAKSSRQIEDLQNQLREAQVERDRLRKQVSDLSAPRKDGAGSLPAQLVQAEQRASALERMLREVDVKALSPLSLLRLQGNQYRERIHLILDEPSQGKSGETRLYLVTGGGNFSVQKSGILVDDREIRKELGDQCATKQLPTFSVRCFELRDGSNYAQLLGSFRSGDRSFRLIAGAQGGGSQRLAVPLTLVIIPEPPAVAQYSAK